MLRRPSVCAELWCMEWEYVALLVVMLFALAVVVFCVGALGGYW